MKILIYGHLIKQLITDKIFMLERICLQFRNGQLTLFLHTCYLEVKHILKILSNETF